MWFEDLTGFREAEVGDVAEHFDVDGEWLISRHNGRRMRAGRFTAPSLAELAGAAPAGRGAATTLREVVDDVRALHRDPGSAGALFQVASQFNTLEMPSPSVTPEAGVSAYEHDHTQGPACAVACGAGTIWRNWFVELPGGRGQRSDRQVDTLGDLVAAAGTTFDMHNGYALPTAGQLSAFTSHLAGLDPAGREALAGHLRIGLQADTEVTLHGAGHTVTQAYCSAVPVAYSEHDADAWEPVARLVLDAAYDATLAAGRINAAATGNPTVHLTLLGGGVFGNPVAWIVDAIARALRRHADAGLDVTVVSHGAPNPALGPLLG